MNLPIVFLLFFLSGATGLIYEVVWFARLEQAFGVTTYALGVVLAAYMAGLGAGAWVFGRLADRPGRPASRYAALELGIGLWALASPFVLLAVEAIYARAGGLGGGFVGLGVKSVLGLLALFPATFLMGGTLPVLARPFTRSVEDTPRAVGVLYGANTLGAVFGTLLAGFVLLPQLGIDASIRFTAVVNILLAAVALSLGPLLAEPIDKSEPTNGPPPWRSARLALALAFGTGFISLLLEVAWTRAFSLALGATTHVFPVVLAATLVGIGVGSILVARSAPDAKRARQVLLLCLVFVAAGSVVFIALYVPFLRALYQIVQSRMFYYGEALTVQLLLCMGMIAPVTLALGMAFPLVMRQGISTVGDAGERLGTMLLFNTMGAIAGSVLAAFVFVPLLGTVLTLKLAAVVTSCVVAFLAVAWWHGPGGRTWLPAALVVGVAAVALPGWAPEAVDLNPTRVRPSDLPDEPGRYRDAFIGGGLSQPFSREGLNAHVSVRRSGNSTQLRIGGKTDASTLDDMSTQILFGLLPFMAHPTAEHAVLVGVGSGTTARVMSDMPSLKQLDIIEIESAVVEAARNYFQEVNHGVLDRPSTRLIDDDARTFFLRERQQAKYDIIVSEPTNPSVAGVANLFTREHYHNSRRSLREDGVYVQWIQLYESDEWQLKAMLRTFLESFRYADLWWSYPADLLLIGRDTPLVYDRAALRDLVSKNPGLRADMWPRLYSNQTDDLFARFLLSGVEVGVVVQSGEILTDKHPKLAHHAARTRYEGTTAFGVIDFLWKLRQARPSRWPDVHPVPTADEESELQVATARFLVHPSPADALAVLDGVRGPEAAALRARATTSVGAKQRILAEALREDPDLAVLQYARARVLARIGERDAAMSVLAELLAAGWRPPADFHLLRSQLLDPTDPVQATEIVKVVGDGLRAIFPRDEDVLVRAQLLERLAECAPVSPQALALLELQVRQKPYDVEASLALTAGYQRVGRFAESLEVLDGLQRVAFTQYKMPARRLRLSALQRLESSEFPAELEAFLDDFPGQRRDPELMQLLR